MLGVNINCKTQDFINQILNGDKTIETRNTPSLRPYVGKRIGLIKTGCGKAILCGYATITKEVHYKNEEEFRYDEDKHLVQKGNVYDIVTEKYGYLLSDVVRIKPLKVNSKGIIARKL